MSTGDRYSPLSLLISLPALAAIGIIRLYRYTLSSLVGRTCRHLPTCSEYADLAIGRFGLWRGGWMAVARFWRCRPFGSRGFDPVPEELPTDATWRHPWRYGTWSSQVSPQGRSSVPSSRTPASGCTRSASCTSMSRSTPASTVKSRE
jgi:uncharacterized protein